MAFKYYYPLIFIVFAATLASLVNLLTTNQEIYFVDAARYADVARNLVTEGKLAGNFAYFSENLMKDDWLVHGPPVNYYINALFFKFFGINDSSIIFTSSLFFVLSSVLVYLIGLKIFNSKTAILSAIFYILNLQLLGYARDGASEPLFIFQILLAALFIVIGKRWSLVIAGIVLAIALFTKLQAGIVIVGFLLWVLLLFRKDFIKVGGFIVPLIVVILFNKLGILFPQHSVGLPNYLLFQQTKLFPGDDLPRSGKTNLINLEFIFANSKTLMSKLFYNSYNFFKIIFSSDNLLPPLTAPFITMNYLFSNLLLLKDEKKEQRYFRIITLFLLFISMVTFAITSPHIRYFHIFLPFMIIIFSDFIINILEKFNLSNKKINAVLFLIVIAFGLLPFLGSYILDSRFRRSAYNTNKPYAHKVLGEKVGLNSGKNDLVVTNLDTWGSWYGKRKTVLIPVNLSDLEKLDKAKRVDIIFLTDFQKDNEDHPLNNEWEKMFVGSNEVSSKYILDNFVNTKSGKVSSSEVYENREFSYKIWTRR